MAKSSKTIGGTAGGAKQPGNKGGLKAAKAPPMHSSKGRKSARGC